MKTLPSGRRDGIIVRELADEVLIYDSQRDKAHCLNKTAAFVWQHCDGRTQVATAARLLAADTQTSVDESVVLLALPQLPERHLLIALVPQLSGVMVSRRRLMLQHTADAPELQVILSIYTQ